MAIGYGGTKTLTGDGVVGISGQPFRLYSVTWLSSGTAGVLVLRNGIADSATALITIAGTISRSVTQNFEGGLLFPAGLFYDHDSNTTIATFSGENEV
jgi:hypothetical protein